MVRRLIDESDGPMFGRRTHLAELKSRIWEIPRGVTTVVGRPQQGKSRFVRELVDQLRLSGPQSPDYVVGFARTSGDTQDVMLRALADLYETWLYSSTWRGQARSLWARHKKDVIAHLGKAASDLLAPLLETHPAIPVPEVVKTIFDGLIKADEDLKTGGLRLKPLAYDQIFGLTKVIHDLTGLRLLIVIDAVEQSPDARRAMSLLRQFLEEYGRWPKCHFLFAVRNPGEDEEEEAAYLEANRLEKAHGGIAAIYDLLPMDLRSILEQDELCNYVKGIVPACLEMSSDEILEQLAGYPGALYRWKTEKPTTVEELKKITVEAQTYQYPELRRVLDRVRFQNRKLFDFAIRLSLLAEIESMEDWNAFTNLFEETGLLVTDLHYEQLLESCDPPSFGHTTRLEAMWAELREHFSADLSHACNSLGRDLAERIDIAEIATSPYALALARLINLHPNPSDVSLGLSLAAISIFSESLPGPYERFMQSAADAARTNSALAPLVAIGLYNTSNFAQREGLLQKRDALLNELRQLALHVNQSVVLERFAMALYNALYYAQKDDDLSECDTLFIELRHLAEVNPEHPIVQDRLAMGLFNMLKCAKQQDDLLRRDELLAEIRKMADAHSDRPIAIQAMAKGLFNTMCQVTREGNLTRRDALLDELRQLAQSHLERPEVLEELAKGLVKSLNHAKQECNLIKRDALLEELRQLASDSDQAAILSALAKSLVNTLNDAKQNGDLPKRDALLDELRQLAKTHDYISVVVHPLAKGLFNALIDAQEEGNYVGRDALLDELRELSVSHGEPDVVEELAKALVNCLNYAKQADDLLKRDSRMDELRQLAKAHGAQTSVISSVAMAMFNTLRDAKHENRLDKRDLMLDELRQLAKGCSDQRAVLEELAKSLFVAVVDANQEKDLEKCRTLIRELNQLLPHLAAESEVHAKMMSLPPEG